METPSPFTPLPHPSHHTPNPLNCHNPTFLTPDTAYLVSWKQQRQPCPQAGRVQNQRGTQMCCETVLTDPRDVVRVWLLFQPALHHVPPQQPLTEQEGLEPDRAAVAA